MNERAPWGNFWRYILGIGACAVLGWYAFVRGQRVPLLGLVDLGFHEFGHLVTYVFPAVVTAAMGSIMQVLVPAGLAAYFLWLRRDLFAGAICLAWTGTSAQDASVYIADAPFERLQLLGGEHDWAFVLGPEHLDMLDSAGTIAAVVKGFGLVLLIAGLVCCAIGLFRRSQDSEERMPTPLAPADSMWG